MSNWKNVSGSWDDLRKREAKKQEFKDEEERRKTARENLKAFNEKQNDWYGTCRHCGKERTGTLKELSAPCDCQKEKVA